MAIDGQNREQALTLLEEVRGKLLDGQLDGLTLLAVSASGEYSPINVSVGAQHSRLIGSLALAKAFVMDDWTRKLRANNAATQSANDVLRGDAGGE